MLQPESDQGKRGFFDSRSDILLKSTSDIRVSKELPEIRLYSPFPSHLEVGAGQYLILSGECDLRGRDIVSMEAEYDGYRQSMELSPSTSGVSFWHALYISPESKGVNESLLIRVIDRDGYSFETRVGGIEERKACRNPVDSPACTGEENLIAICLASYEPNMKAFARQIDSIRNQDYECWVCIVNDDGSSDETWYRMREYCKDDTRFLFFRNTENLGFYRNFEKALSRVPEDAVYIALSDQDDFWYPNKLSALLRVARKSNPTLVYSDMRIVDSEGVELSSTYWVGRRNEYSDLSAVLVANTVTGAACLFRSELLDVLLPFPPKVGDAFHDHWIACAALSVGRLEYIDQPLYDYYQYGNSVIGHCDFQRFTLLQRIVSMIRFVGRVARPSIGMPLLRGKYAAALAIYRGECRRLRIICHTLIMRCRPTGKTERQLELFDGGWRSVLKLLILHARVLARRQTTDDAELRLAMGEFARIVERRKYKYGSG